MVDIARSPSVVKKKKIKRAVMATVALGAIILVTVAVSRLKPAAPSVDRAAVWVDTVKRGPMLRLVRGSGTLVPEDIRWINTTTQGRVERIVLRSNRRSRMRSSPTRPRSRTTRTARPSSNAPSCSRNPSWRALRRTIPTRS